jgi:hypothetical protein
MVLLRRQGAPAATKEYARKATLKRKSGSSGEIASYQEDQQRERLGTVTNRSLRQVPSTDAPPQVS